MKIRVAGTIERRNTRSRDQRPRKPRERPRASFFGEHARCVLVREARALSRLVFRQARLEEQADEALAGLAGLSLAERVEISLGFRERGAETRRHRTLRRRPYVQYASERGVLRPDPRVSDSNTGLLEHTANRARDLDRDVA